ncbi:hypothetical protein L7F22_004388 [Adiantum nelumboides]|nr:hypothetical protein [Adiantum nelumboides]
MGSHFKHGLVRSMEKLHVGPKKVERIEIALRRTTAALTAIPPIAGAAIDHIQQKFKHYDGDTDGSTSDSDSEVEVEAGIDSEGHHKEVADIQPFLNMAMAAYDDTSMAEKFSYVRSSQLVKDLADPTILNRDKNITTDTEVHVCVLEDGSLAFAFRGTEFQFEDLRSLFGDLMTDMMKTQIPVVHHDASEDVAFRAAPSIKAHQGFQLAFRDVTRTSRSHENIRLVAEGLGASAPCLRRVICIGHSLGGALATLCAQWCRYVAYPSAEVWCVTIGSPRVGNKAFSQDFNQHVVTKGRSYRVVNKGDVVPNVPLFDRNAAVLSVYKHVEGFIYLSATTGGTVGQRKDKRGFEQKGQRVSIGAQPRKPEEAATRGRRQEEEEEIEHIQADPIPSSPLNIPPSPPSSAITPFPPASTPRTPPSPLPLDLPRSPPAPTSPQQQ